MRTSGQGKGLSFKEAVGIFWEWRQASISVEVCFFSKAQSSDTVRVSIDGLVSLVDPEGIITISGDGREIELDLRGCRFQHAKASRSQEGFDPLDPNSILQVKFPNEEVCLVFPYRRVALSAFGHRRATNGLEWLRSKLGNPVEKDSKERKESRGPKPHRISFLWNGRDRGAKPGTSRTGPPVLPLAAVLIVFVMAAFALTPSNLPKLISQLGWIPRPTADPNAQVWAIRQVGNYYCSGSVLAGRQPGRFMKQANALALGYQPALGHYCGNASGAPGAGRRQTGYVSSYLRQMRRSGNWIFSRLFRLTRSLFSRPYESSAANPAALPLSYPGTSPRAILGSETKTASPEAASTAGKVGSAASWSPVSH